MSYDNTVQQTKHKFRFVGEGFESRPLPPASHHIRIGRHPEFDFEPVQHTRLSLNTTGESGRFDTSRPMSLATSPTREYLEYSVNGSESDFKQTFVDLESGDEVMVEGSRGISY